MFILDNNGAEPLYRQLYRQIREQVLSGRLPAHARLPSVRDLAAELSVSRNTVEGAYQELLAEGYLYSRERSGCFVSELEQDIAAVSPLTPPQIPSPSGVPCEVHLRLPSRPARSGELPGRDLAQVFPGSPARECRRPDAVR